MFVADGWQRQTSLVVIFSIVLYVYVTMTAANYKSGKYYEAKAPCLNCGGRIRRQGYPSTVANKRYCSIPCRAAHQSNGHTRQCTKCEQTKPRSMFGRYGKVCNTCIGQAYKARLAQEPYRAQWGNYTHRARCHKPPIPFELLRAEFNAILGHPCHYCGTTQSPRGLDRINTDDAVGYTLLNVVPACFVCNRMRMHVPYEAFLAHMRAIIANHPGDAGVYCPPKGLHPWQKKPSV